MLLVGDYWVFSLYSQQQIADGKYDLIFGLEALSIQISLYNLTMLH